MASDLNPEVEIISSKDEISISISKMPMGQKLCSVLRINRP